MKDGDVGTDADESRGVGRTTPGELGAIFPQRSPNPEDFHKSLSKLRSAETRKRISLRRSTSPAVPFTYVECSERRNLVTAMSLSDSTGQCDVTEGVSSDQPGKSRRI